jgi:hypothetical protein
MVYLEKSFMNYSNAFYKKKEFEEFVGLLFNQFD